MQTVILKVSGMSCGHCVKSIENAIRKSGGSAKVDLRESTVTVEFDETQVSIEIFKETIKSQGYIL